MPLYEYACSMCHDLRFDVNVPYEQRDEPQTCPNCANDDSVSRKMPIAAFKVPGGYDGRLKQTPGDYKTK